MSSGYRKLLHFPPQSSKQEDSSITKESETKDPFLLQNIKKYNAKSQHEVKERKKNNDNVLKLYRLKDETKR